MNRVENCSDSKRENEEIIRLHSKRENRSQRQTKRQKERQPNRITTTIFSDSVQMKKKTTMKLKKNKKKTKKTFKQAITENQTKRSIHKWSRAYLYSPRKKNSLKAENKYKLFLVFRMQCACCRRQAAGTSVCSQLYRSLPSENR